ncbi:phage head spike fiber domain-containing protein [Aeromonas hydrophila]|uniref:phage head spike fiber domain-containing protein n=1 Tax=Aeromonas hydrophila TaxID=644 RepID=UPI00145597F1|nr:hypothetical protein [Aeromonas hydrophila]NLR36855.1 hypothetical protein [Aeromonas hydrophila]
MAGLWKRDGTVAVTSGSKKVTGTGTTFADAKNGVAKGHLFCMTTGATVDLYEVDYVVSNTELFLVQAFRGVTGTGKAYEVITTFSDSIPEFARKLNASLSYYQGQSDMVQQLFTSDAAEITVTAPDGTTHKLVPWKRVTSDGEGQAARAKVEADRSKTEADRSGTEADRAAGIVAAAALPLPDVWAPLSDSLRLITGYGRDVLVGSDVVARMVNFSRSTTATYIGKDGQLKTAAANEPRFEKEGILVEGQSTNIWWTQGAGLSVVNSPIEQITLPTGVVGSAYKITPNTTDFSYVRTSYGLQSGVHTLSCFAKRADGSLDMPIIYAGQGGALSIKMVGKYLGNGWWRMECQLTNPIGNTGFGFAATAIDTIPVHICFFQFEALPFASSYIPTNGAAATRSKDILYLASSGNIPADMNMAFAAQIKLMGKGVNSWPRVFEISDPANKGSFIDMNTGTWGANNIVGIRRTIAARFSDTSRWLDGVNISSPWQAYPVKPYSDPVYITGSNVAGTRDYYGHVRNLRAWFFSPTDDQMKAIR